MSIKSGDETIIEERKGEELTHFMGVRSAPADAGVYNPSFDVTPHQLISGIITEKGVIIPPFDKNLERLTENAQVSSKG
jgi:methylthioribose-1-phosphate isomerase